MARNATLIATLTRSPEALPAGAEAAGCLEVRADRLLADGGEVAPPSYLRDRFAGELLYTLRSEQEGGAFSGGRADRRQLLAAAAESYDLVDLEINRDLDQTLLEQIPAAKRVLSWHGGPSTRSQLERRLAALQAIPARLYKFVSAANEVEEQLAPLEFLAATGRDDIVAFALGAGGAWTRLVAPYLGAPIVYAALGDEPAAPGQPLLARLVEDFGLPELRDLAGLSGIIGQPVSHSLSPRLHNAAYRALGLPLFYLPFHADSFADLWLAVVEGRFLPSQGLPVRALSITAPYKRTALAVAGASSPLAQRIDSANTLVRRHDVWEAETTDPAGVTEPLLRRGLDLGGRRAAVIGCGGAGRAAAAGLLEQGSEVVMVNRTESRGRQVAKDLAVPFVPLSELDPSRFSLLVNATSLGHGADDALPFDPAATQSGTAIVDLVYGAEPTALEDRARAQDVIFVGGREVLLFQALEQFRVMTGATYPLALGQQLLGLEVAA